ncbi:MAG: dihydroorotate dehydrogenase electron transfer subunit [Bacillota bacterium]
MKKIETRVVSMENIAKATYQLVIHVETDVLKTIKPGQFVHIKVGEGTEHMLRRPISICDVNVTEETMTLIFKVFGKGTDKLATLKPSHAIDLLIPCGNGYPMDEIEADHVLLIGGGIGVPPLYYLGKQLVNKGIKVTSILGFQSAADVFYEEAFQTLGAVYVATNDGTYGTRGFVTDVVDDQSLSGDYYFSCGPTPMLQAVETKFKDTPGYLSLEERMGCGIGACYACVVKTIDGESTKKVCQDGPVFKANEVQL